MKHIIGGNENVRAGEGPMIVMYVEVFLKFHSKFSYLSLLPVVDAIDI